MVLSTYALSGPVSIQVEGFPSVKRSEKVVLVDLDMAPVPLNWGFLDLGINFQEYVEVVGYAQKDRVLLNFHSDGVQSVAGHLYLPL